MKGLWELKCNCCDRLIPYAGETCIFCRADKSAIKAAHDKQRAREQEGLSGVPSVAFALTTGFAAFVASEMMATALSSPNIGFVLASVVSASVVGGIIGVTNPGLVSELFPKCANCGAIGLAGIKKCVKCREPFVACAAAIHLPADANAGTADAAWPLLQNGIGRACQAIASWPPLILTGVAVCAEFVKRLLHSGDKLK